MSMDASTRASTSRASYRSAYTLFAAALVLAIGVVLRRTAVADRPRLRRVHLRPGSQSGAGRVPNYQAPIEETWAGDAAGIDLRGAWVLSQTGELRAVGRAAAGPGGLEHMHPRTPPQKKASTMPAWTDSAS